MRRATPVYGSWERVERESEADLPGGCLACWTVFLFWIFTFAAGMFR